MTDILKIKAENEALNTRINQYDEQLTDILQQVVEQINRGLRLTLIFKNITRDPSEKSWDDAAKTLAKEINSYCPEI